jgi:cytochrome P450
MFGKHNNYSLVCCNFILIRAMCQNEEKYPNADAFNPDRFLNPDGTLTDDTVSVAWGFGRRICPGRYLAEASLLSAMTCLLAVFKFSKAKDETGREIEIEPKWHGGITMCVFRRIRRRDADFIFLGDPCISLAASLRGMQK